MNRASEITYLTRYVETKSNRYLPVSAAVADAMGLENGEYLVVTVSRPKTDDRQPILSNRKETS